MDRQGILGDMTPVEGQQPAGSAADGIAGAPRLRRAVRDQVEMHCAALDELVPDDHPVRTIWQYVEQLDLSPLTQPIKAVQGQRGRDATDPQILLALWLWATIDGVGSARRLDALCQRDLLYRWVCGGVSVNYHLLSDFRTAQVEFLDRLLTESVASLMREGLVDLNRVAQDGMRVRASAGSDTFRRRETLEECRAKAQQQVEVLKQELQQDSSQGTRRHRAARQRATRERQQRVQEALAHAQELAARREARKKGDGSEARASTTDPEARRMKFPGGGFHPGYNVQLATDTKSGIIAGADVTNSGSDGGLMAPMVEQVSERYGMTPAEWLVDGGFATKHDIEQAAARGTKPYAPVKEQAEKRAKGQDPFAPRPGDSPAVAEWRQRMGTDEAKEIYKERASTAEWANAQLRNHNLRLLLVRGLKKVKAVLLWFVLAHNVLRMATLRAAATPAAA